MAAKAKTDTAENFVGSVFKFSIPTFATIGILGLSMLITGNLIPKEVFGPADLFVSYTNMIMTLAILGLDQAFIRFYHEPPAKLSKNGLFRLCFSFSSIIILVAGTICSTLLLEPVYNLIGFGEIDQSVVWAGRPLIPMLFLNAFFFMCVRYFVVMYRMEMNIKVYSVVTILMQFFWKLFYLLGYFFKNPVLGMAVTSLAGFGGFVLVFGFKRRKMLRPRAEEYRSGAYKVLLPYGFAIAPTAVFLTLGAQLPKSYLVRQLGVENQAVYSFSYSLSNIVALVQGGFAAFWGAYMYENYKTQQPRIQKMHDFLNFIILVFFSLLVAFQDVVFFFFREYRHTQAVAIFPLMMLSAVFTILCETTVYGNTIARRPIFDTIGIGLSMVTNIVSCMIFVPRFGQENGLYGAAMAVALANLVMFLFRTFTAQKLYRTIRSPLKTAAAILVAIGLTVAGTVLAYSFWYKLLASVIAIGVFCLMYREELKRCWNLALTILQNLFSRFKK